ncbi:MAG: hypothetical protein AB1758_35850, partial [Candidatus Eremiobacterota bacterium]
MNIQSFDPSMSAAGRMRSLARPESTAEREVRYAVEDGVHQGRKLGHLVGASVLSVALPVGTALAAFHLGAPWLAGLAISPVGLVTGMVMASLAERHIGLGQRLGGLVGGAVGAGVGLARATLNPEPRAASTAPIDLPRRAPTGEGPREALAPRLLHAAQERLLGGVPDRNTAVEISENVFATASSLVIGGLAIPAAAVALFPALALPLGTIAGPALGVVLGGVLENTLGLGRATGELVGHAAHKVLAREKSAQGEGGPLATRLLHRAQEKVLGNVPERTRTVKLSEALFATGAAVATGLALSALVPPLAGMPLLSIALGGVLESQLGVGRAVGEVVGHGLRRLEGDKPAEGGPDTALGGLKKA